MREFLMRLERLMRGKQLTGYCHCAEKLMYTEMTKESLLHWTCAASVRYQHPQELQLLAVQATSAYWVHLRGRPAQEVASWLLTPGLGMRLSSL